jgi:large subunit ribosomal protein L6
MSRIGKKPVVLPQGVKAEQAGETLKVTGKLGSLQLQCHPSVKIKIEGSTLWVENPTPEDRMARQMHGTTRALIANMVAGVTQGYTRKLEIYGTGFNVKEQGGKLILTVGYCNPVELPVPQGIKVQIEVAATKGNEVPAKFNVNSMDKCVLGQFAAMIRRVRPPEPYQGKGVRYADEHIKRKVGKAFASGSSA